MTLLTALPAISTWGGAAPAITGGASSSPGGLVVGGAIGRPARFRIPGYTRGQRVLSTPTQIAAHLQTEFEKLERAQPNTDTVAIVDDYEIGPFDRTILVDTSIGDVVIQLKPAKVRFALPLVIVKVSRDFNNVRVQAAAGDLINDALGLTWTEPFIAYSLHPDGTTHWWLEGFHEEVTPIAPGQIVKVIVNKRGRVIGSGGPITEHDIALVDVLTLNATIARHGFLPKLPGDASLFLDGMGAWTAPAGSGSSGQIDGGDADSIYGGTTPVDGGGA